MERDSVTQRISESASGLFLDRGGIRAGHGWFPLLARRVCIGTFNYERCDDGRDPVRKIFALSDRMTP
jgi:hypothetical protein